MSRSPGTFSSRPDNPRGLSSIEGSSGFRFALDLSVREPINRARNGNRESVLSCHFQQIHLDSLSSHWPFYSTILAFSIPRCLNYGGSEGYLHGNCWCSSRRQ